MRDVMGFDKPVVEQKVLLTTDAAQARATGASVLKFYSRAPGYVNAWKRMGFTDDDISGLSDRLVDGRRGTADQIEPGFKSMLDAGAPMLHPSVGSVTGQGAPDDAAPEALAPSWRRHSLAGMFAPAVKLAPRCVSWRMVPWAPVGGVPARCSGRDGGPGRGASNVERTTVEISDGIATSASTAATK